MEDQYQTPFLPTNESQVTLNKDEIRKWWFGCFLLLLVNIFLVTSSELSQYLYDNEDYDKPFVISYVSTSLFSLYLILLFLIEKFNENGSTLEKIKGIENLQGSISYLSETELNSPLDSRSNQSSNASSFPILCSCFPVCFSWFQKDLESKKSLRLSIIFSPIYFFGIYCFYFSTQYTSVSSATIIQSLQVVFAFVFHLSIQRWTKNKRGNEIVNENQEFTNGETQPNLYDSQEMSYSELKNKEREKRNFIIKTIGIVVTCLGVILVGIDDSYLDNGDDDDDGENTNEVEYKWNLEYESTYENFYLQTNTSTTSDDTGSGSENTTGLGGISLELWGDFFGLLSTLLYSLFSVLFDHFFTQIIHEEDSIPSSISNYSPSPILPSRARSSSFTSARPKGEIHGDKEHRTKRYPEGSSSSYQLRMGQIKSGRTDFERSLYFFGVLGLSSFLLFWPIGILFHLTGLEQFELPSFSVLFNLVILALLGATLTDLLWVLAILWTNAVLANVALVLGIPIAMAADMALGKFIPSYLYACGALLTLIGFVIVHWSDLPSRIKDEEIGSTVSS